MKRERMFEDYLTKLKDAPERVGRSKATIYRWIAEGRIKVIRPTRDKYVFTHELLQAERDTGGRGLR